MMRLMIGSWRIRSNQIVYPKVVEVVLGCFGRYWVVEVAQGNNIRSGRIHSEDGGRYVEEEQAWSRAWEFIEVFDVQ